MEKRVNNMIRTESLQRKKQSKPADLNTEKGQREFKEFAQNHPARTNADEAKKFLYSLGMYDEDGKLKEEYR